jgi:hypothetical protein
MIELMLVNYPATSSSISPSNVHDDKPRSIAFVNLGLSYHGHYATGIALGDAITVLLSFTTGTNNNPHFG